MEDKIVQSADVEVLNYIYEIDFLSFFYEFRPERSAHRALDEWATALQTKEVNWVVELDISSFFDRLNQLYLVKFREHRIAGKRMLRPIQKWLRAGISEGGAWKPTVADTSQGATVSLPSHNSSAVCGNPARTDPSGGRA